MINKKEFLFNFSATETTLSLLTDRLRGEVLKVVIEVPEFTNDITTTVTVKNGIEMYVSEPLPDNEEYNITLCRNECILMRHVDECLEVVLSGVAGGTGGEVIVNLYVESQ